ncbi:PDR/VanB family oxidoreductase [Sulfitobacter aestuariivivens]|uniref:Oxidoreductase n=1 Tax=Sulfitobacter aestuariivivens TaxID=2766981 RepID=A0A927D9R6_9RHOB|nr:PDR/VanB family oxidoreductase [Sulfitobacter aestuariivivens]MBD3665326.1 oxidoreductase [Sulfitobacter aestuariivivens]
MQLEIAEARDITDRVRLFTLVRSDGADLPEYTAGAHVDFDLGDVGTRSYSLIDFVPIAPLPGAYHIAVQAEHEGDGGSLAMHKLAVGETIKASAPKNSFALHESNAPAVLIAGGIGVTPIVSFATELDRRGTPFAFHYAARSRDVCALADTLEERFGDALTFWFDDDRMIDVAGLLKDAPDDAHVFCCGPKGMIEAVRTAAEAAGYPGDRIRFELFETPQAEGDDTSFEVEINDGQVFTIPPDKSIIDVLEDAGLDIMYDCQRGDCGICQTDVLEGEPDHRDVVLSDAERAAGDVMQICVSRAKSPRLKLDI